MEHVKEVTLLPVYNQKSQEKAKEAQINHLYRHIGQLKVERDFCRKGPVYESQHTGLVKPSAGVGDSLNLALVLS